MNKMNLRILMGFGFTLMLHFSILAQTTSNGGQAKIKFMDQNTTDRQVVLSYVLPYPGVVELRLFNFEESLIYRQQYINLRGENAIHLKNSAFASGQVYRLQLNYKQDVFRKEVVVNQP